MTRTKVLILIAVVMASMLSCRPASLSNNSLTSNPLSSQARLVSHPPIISNVSISSVTEESATVSWRTNTYCTSKILFKMNMGGPLDRQVSLAPSLFHSINLANLASGQTYYITLQCSDNNGNISKLERTFTILRQQKIAYTSLINGRDQIYCMNADGSNQVRLSDGNNRDFSPVWSPNGTKIAFVSARDGDLRLYIMNADGTDQKRLTRGDNKEFTPSWSPDGQKIAFISIMNALDRFRINILDVNSGQVTQLGIYMTPLVEKLTGDYEPAWSPDGKKIAYMSSGYNLCDQIFVVSAEGGEPVQLTDGYNYEGEPAWSPDSKKIIYCRYSMGNSQIYIMNADGTNQTRLTHGSDDYPAWSPDGKKIAFSSNRDAFHQIYVMNDDGSNQTQLTHDSHENVRPVWSP